MVVAAFLDYVLILTLEYCVRAFIACFDVYLNFFVVLTALETILHLPPQVFFPEMEAVTFPPVFSRRDKIIQYCVFTHCAI